MSEQLNGDTDYCDRCGDRGVLGRVNVKADYDGAMTAEYRLCQDCIRSLGEWYRKPDGEWVGETND